jgi:hypothetical protein
LIVIENQLIELRIASISVKAVIHKKEIPNAWILIESFAENNLPNFKELHTHGFFLTYGICVILSVLIPFNKQLGKVLMENKNIIYKQRRKCYLA